MIRFYIIDLEGGVLSNDKGEKTCKAGEPKGGEGEIVNLGLGLVHCVLVNRKALKNLFMNLAELKTHTDRTKFNHIGVVCDYEYISLP